MRRTGGPALVGLGAFLLATALLLGFYAYPRLAGAAPDVEAVATLVARNAYVYDMDTLTHVTTTLTTRVRTDGDAAASARADGDTVVWVRATTTRAGDGTLRSRRVERAAFDASTGRAVNCCGEHVLTRQNQPSPVRHEGLVFRFPVDTEQRDYLVWDGVLGRAAPARFVGVTELEGLRVYKFVQIIEPTVVGSQRVPARVLGIDRPGRVRAQVTYASTRALWVEPVTGGVVKRRENRRRTLRYHGEDLLVLADVVATYTDRTVHRKRVRFQQLKERLTLLRGPLPWGTGVAGVLLILTGLIVRRSGVRQTISR